MVAVTWTMTMEMVIMVMEGDDDTAGGDGGGDGAGGDGGGDGVGGGGDVNDGGDETRRRVPAARTETMAATTGSQNSFI